MIKKLLFTTLFIFSLIGNCFADGNDSNTVSLLHMDGADASTTFTDSAVGGTHTWTARGNAQLDTAQKEFGTASGLFNGAAGTKVDTDDSADWSFGTGNFTVDFWVMFNDLSGSYYTIWSTGEGAPDYANRITTQYAVATTTLWFSALVSSSSVADYTFSWTPDTAQWYHLAYVRNGTSFKIFIDGVSQALTENTAISTNTMPNVSALFNVGGQFNTQYGLNGWVDEFRVSKDIARWTANFTPPIAEYDDLPPPSAAPSGQVIWMD